MSNIIVSSQHLLKIETLTNTSENNSRILPIVDIWVLQYSCLVYWHMMHVFPTPVSPTRRRRNKWSYLFDIFVVRSAWKKLSWLGNPMFTLQNTVLCVYYATQPKSRNNTRSHTGDSRPVQDHDIDIMSIYRPPLQSLFKISWDTVTAPSCLRYSRGRWRYRGLPYHQAIEESFPIWTQLNAPECRAPGDGQRWPIAVVIITTITKFQIQTSNIYDNRNHSYICH